MLFYTQKAPSLVLINYVCLRWIILFPIGGHRDFNSNCGVVVWKTTVRVVSIDSRLYFWESFDRGEH